MNPIAKAGRYLNLSFLSLSFLFLYIPILVLIIFSFNVDRFPSPWTAFTWDWYKQLFFSSHSLWNAFANSLTIALSATTISVVVGLLLIFHAAQGGKVQKILSFFYANLIIPEIVLAVALLGYFSFINVPLGITTLIISHTILAFGYVIPILCARFFELDPKLTEASLVLGATEIQTFFKITLPLLRPAIVSTSVLVFVISFDDFVLSYFCAGSDYQTLSLYILSMLRSEVSPIVNALSTLLVFLSSALAFVYFSIKSRTRIW